MKYQKGFVQFNFGPIFLVFGIICAALGWAVIESLIWLYHHIDISFIN